MPILVHASKEHGHFVLTTYDEFACGQPVQYTRGYLKTSKFNSFGARRFRQRKIFSHLLFGDLPHRDVLRGSHQAPYYPACMPHGEPRDPDPSGRMARSDDSQFFVEISGLDCLFDASQNPDAILGMKKLN